MMKLIWMHFVFMCTVTVTVMNLVLSWLRRLRNDNHNNYSSIHVKSIMHRVLTNIEDKQGVSPGAIAAYAVFGVLFFCCWCGATFNSGQSESEQSHDESNPNQQRQESEPTITSHYYWNTQIDGLPTDHEQPLQREVLLPLPESRQVEQGLRVFYQSYIAPHTMIAKHDDFINVQEHESPSTSSSGNNNSKRKDKLPHDAMQPILLPAATTGDNRGDNRSSIGSVNGRAVAVCCAICLTEYKVGDAIVWSFHNECPHAFHQECILSWLGTGKKRCPVCRNWFVPQQLAHRGGIMEPAIATSQLTVPLGNQDHEATSGSSRAYMSDEHHYEAEEEASFSEMFADIDGDY